MTDDARQRLVLIGPRVSDWWPLRDRGVPVTVVTLEESDSDAAFTEPRGWRHVALELTTRTRRRWTGRDLAELASLVAPELDAGSLVVPYGADPAIAEVAGTRSATVASIHHTLRRRLEDRAWVRSSLAALAVDVVPHHEIHAGVSFDKLVRTFGLPLIVQSSPSSAGMGTFYVHTEVEFRDALGRVPGRGIVSPHAGDVIVNIHVLVDANGLVLVSRPSIQLAGVPGVVDQPGAFCGNDFAAGGTLGTKQRERAASLAATIGAWLQSLGYRGLAGVDFVVSGQRCAMLEVNPRLQASTWMLAADEGSASMLDQHLACWSAPGDATFADLPTTSSQLQFPHARSTWTETPPSPGTYEVGPGSLRRVSTSVDTRRCPPDGVVIFGTPRRGVHVSEGGVVTRVAVPTSIAGTTSGELNDYGRALVRLLQRRAFVGTPLTPT